MCKHADDDTTFIKRVTVRGERTDGRRPTVIRMREIDGKIINDEPRHNTSVYDIVIIIILLTTVKSKYLTTLF